MMFSKCKSQAADSWAVLDTYGNMLLPSIMFVLDRVFQRQQKHIADKNYNKFLFIVFYQFLFIFLIQIPYICVYISKSILLKVTLY